MTAGGSHLRMSESRPGTPAGVSVPAKGRAYLATLEGFVGALMMFVGSIGTGWIANGSP